MPRLLRALALALLLLGCANDDSSSPGDALRYYVDFVRPAQPVEGLTLLDLTPHLQSTEYTCGPSAVVSLLDFFNRPGDEMGIATEMGTSPVNGSSPDQMTNWLNANGFQASWHENGSLELLRARLENQQPTLVEWSDWGGHWVLVIGYDERDPDDVMDDVIIFADPYDYHDDHPDGISWFNAQRFYYMWYDALLFERVLRRVFIDTTLR